jgi:signal recognition particle receptor subunit beta
MVLINYATKEIVAKVVYYGPGLCGKTTNLQHIYTRLNPKKRGKMISIATQADRTLFFDFLPVELGVVQGFKVRFQLYTVPGQVFYGATRKLVLKGADAVVFVADSQADVLSKNVESLEDLKHNLMENGLDPEAIPIVFQYNKRDLPNVMDAALLDSKVNYRQAPSFEASAITGMGVMETIKGVITLLIKDLKRKHSMMDSGIKELPADMFEPKREEAPPETALELEMGSAIRDEEHREAGEEKEPESILDQVETITLADTLQAEVFFDTVRAGREAEEAKEKAQTAGQTGGIELSHASGEFEVEHDMDDSRELTPEEITDAADEGYLGMDMTAPEMMEPEGIVAAPIFDKPVLEPVRESAPEPVREPVREPVKESAPEPVREPVQEPVREPVRKSVTEIVSESSPAQGTNLPAFDIIPLIERMTRLEESVAELKNLFEGRDQLMLSVLEALRDLKKNFLDSNEKIEDALKDLTEKVEPRKKKWF